MQATSR
jgi:GNAT superfamily N-acetyltransferase